MNRVFIATSMDGFIADSQGNIDWLHSIPNPEQDDMGYADFMKDVDALVMGRKTYEVILGFGIEWPYRQPVFVVSRSLQSVPEALSEQVFIVKGPLTELFDRLRSAGHQNLYIDGGQLIQSALNADLIDELIITTIPLILGGGTPLFSECAQRLTFKCVASKLFLGQVVQNHFVRNR